MPGRDRLRRNRVPRGGGGRAAIGGQGDDVGEVGIDGAAQGLHAVVVVGLGFEPAHLGAGVGADVLVEDDGGFAAGGTPVDGDGIEVERAAVGEDADIGAGVGDVEGGGRSVGDAPEEGGGLHVGVGLQGGGGAVNLDAARLGGGGGVAPLDGDAGGVAARRGGPDAGLGGGRVVELDRAVGVPGALPGVNGPGVLGDAGELGVTGRGGREVVGGERVAGGPAGEGGIGGDLEAVGGGVRDGGPGGGEGGGGHVRGRIGDGRGEGRVAGVADADGAEDGLVGDLRVREVVVVVVFRLVVVFRVVGVVVEGVAVGVDLVAVVVDHGAHGNADGDVLGVVPAFVEGGVAVLVAVFRAVAETVGHAFDEGGGELAAVAGLGVEGILVEVGGGDEADVGGGGPDAARAADGAQLFLDGAGEYGGMGGTHGRTGGVAPYDAPAGRGGVVLVHAGGVAGVDHDDDVDGRVEGGQVGGQLGGGVVGVVGADAVVHAVGVDVVDHDGPVRVEGGVRHEGVGVVAAVGGVEVEEGVAGDGL